MINKVTISGQDGGSIYVDWTQTEKAEGFRQSWHESPIIRVPFTTGPTTRQAVANNIKSLHPDYDVQITD